jgi:hypothetical protein
LRDRIAIQQAPCSDIRELRKKKFMFDIQINNPKASEIADENDKTLEDAIESIFPLSNEYAFLIWNHIYIPLTYR